MSDVVSLGHVVELPVGCLLSCAKLAKRILDVSHLGWAGCRLQNGGTGRNHARGDWPHPDCNPTPADRRLTIDTEYPSEDMPCDLVFRKGHLPEFARILS